MSTGKEICISVHIICNNQQCHHWCLHTQHTQTTNKTLSKKLLGQNDIFLLSNVAY